MTNSPATPQAKPNVMRRLYNWMLHWADTPWGTVALFILAFAESSFFPIPPDVLLIALCLGQPKKSFKYALICMAGSVCGAMLGYGIGYWAWEGALQDWFIPHVFSQEGFDGVGALYQEWNFWAVFTAGFTPIPYKIFTIAAGTFQIDFVMFVLASIIGRSGRFFLVGFLIWKFGPSIKGFIDKYFNLIAIAFTVLLIGGFVLIKYVF
ncbi:MAG: YqaA family protein [Rikenellaceae bacterium]